MRKLCLNCIWCDQCNPSEDCSATIEEMIHIAKVSLRPWCDDYTPIYGEHEITINRNYNEFVKQWHDYVEDNLYNFY